MWTLSMINRQLQVAFDILPLAAGPSGCQGRCQSWSHPAKWEQQTTRYQNLRQSKGWFHFFLVFKDTLYLIEYLYLWSRTQRNTILCANQKVHNPLIVTVWKPCADSLSRVLLHKSDAYFSTRDWICFDCLWVVALRHFKPSADGKTGRTFQPCKAEQIKPSNISWDFIVFWISNVIGRLWFCNFGRGKPVDAEAFHGFNMLSATLTFAQTHHCDITETILCCWEVANPIKDKGKN
jgi:hypothetical protein